MLCHALSEADTALLEGSLLRWLVQELGAVTPRQAAKVGSLGCHHTVVMGVATPSAATP